MNKLDYIMLPITVATIIYGGVLLVEAENEMLLKFCENKTGEQPTMICDYNFFGHCIGYNSTIDCGLVNNETIAKEVMT